MWCSLALLILISCLTFPVTPQHTEGLAVFHELPCSVAPSALIGLPHHVQDLHHLFIDHKHDSYVQAHAPESRNSTFVKPGAQTFNHSINIPNDDLYSVLMWSRLGSVSMDTLTYAAGPSYFIIFMAQSTVLLYLCASRPCREIGERTPASHHGSLSIMLIP